MRAAPAAHRDSGRPTPGDQPLYRPPLEARSLIVRVVEGCPQGGCTFCAMYRKTAYRALPMEEIAAQVERARDEARAEGSTPRRAFLAEGDATTLAASRLEEIAAVLRARFPALGTISAYASIRSLAGKSDAELARLAAAGLGELYVGVESGEPRVIASLCKGHTLDEARRELVRLHEAGISFSANLMLGVAGRGRGAINARDTAALLNEARPASASVVPLTLFEGTRLARAAREGRFVEATEREKLEEERALIAALEVPGLRFYGTHPANAVSVFGVLPEDREDMLATLDEALATLDPAFLDTVAERGPL